MHVFNTRRDSFTVLMPAAPGAEVVCAWTDDCGRAKARRYEVIGWKAHFGREPGSNDDFTDDPWIEPLLAMQLDGRDWALVLPDGRLEDSSGTIFGSEEAYASARLDFVRACEQRELDDESSEVER